MKIRRLIGVSAVLLMIGVSSYFWYAFMAMPKNSIADWNIVLRGALSFLLGFCSVGFIGVIVAPLVMLAYHTIEYVQGNELEEE